MIPRTPSAADVAAFMERELHSQKFLYQEVVVYQIQQNFGDAFVYINANGNLAIARAVLQEFRKLTETYAVWMRGERAWRFREEYDRGGRQQE